MALTVRQIIGSVDELKPNAFSTAQKILWLNEAEGLVQVDILLIAASDIVTYGEGDLDHEVLTPPPHSKLYGAYIGAMIDFANGEYGKYDNSFALFNAHFDEYRRWCAHHVCPANGQALRQGYYLSAYGIAVKHGYGGSEEEWLSSLRGERGYKADLRFDGDNLQWKPENETAWEDLIALEELQGDVVAETIGAAQAAADAAAVAQGAVEASADQVAQSALAAADSASAAAGSASAASSSAIATFASESNAASSAQSAGNSASTAASSASSSSSSAIAASASESNAASSAQSAGNSASTAASSASSASSSAMAASASEGNAAFSAQSAENNASASSGSASSSSSSATAASVSEGNAVSSAQSAENSASAAASSALASSSSAVAASVSEGNAAATAQLAENSASAAANSASAASASAESAAESTTLAESWAAGGTGSRPGENTNNAKYWCEAASAAAGGGVTSFNGRGGAVSPIAGDYTAAQVGADAGGTATAAILAHDRNGEAHSDLFVAKSDTGHTHTPAAIGAETPAGAQAKANAAEAAAKSASISLTQKGATNGVAELGADGKVLTTQLPSYVDDVLEYANLAAFPPLGESGKIYIAIDTNRTFRWSGSTYVEISASLALGEISSTAYRGDRGKAAYDHIIDANKHIITAERTKLSGIEAGANAYTHPAVHPPDIIAQDANNRFMTDAERNKLSGIATGANVYTHPATHPSGIIVQDANNRFMTDTERNKLSGIATGANNYAHPAAHPASIIVQDADNRFVSDLEKESWDSKARKTTYMATIMTTWTGTSAPYTQDITIAGILASDDAHITPIYSTNNATAITEKEAWNTISSAVTANNKITLTCFEGKPAVAIAIKVEVIRNG